MIKFFTYLYLFFGITGSFECSNQINDFYSAAHAIERVDSLENYNEAEIKIIEKYQHDMPHEVKLMLANYYIKVAAVDKYNKVLSEKDTELTDIRSKIRSNIEPDISKAARCISSFMIEYMNYDSINKYIKSTEGYETFGDYMKRVNASVVIKDIEGAITAYYFPKLLKEQTWGEWLLSWF